MRFRMHPWTGAAQTVKRSPGSSRARGVVRAKQRTPCETLHVQLDVARVAFRYGPVSCSVISPRFGQRWFEGDAGIRQPPAICRHERVVEGAFAYSRLRSGALAVARQERGPRPSSRPAFTSPVHLVPCERVARTRRDSREDLRLASVVPGRLRLRNRASLCAGLHAEVGRSRQQRWRTQRPS
jgi:hypothetical protein